MVKKHPVFQIVIILVSVLILLFSCSKDEDKRKMVKDQYGEPDQIIKSEFGAYKYELYVYARRDVNRAYEFRKTASGCGGSSQWYVYRMYYADYLGYELYLPPVIKHTPVQSAPPGERIPITAEVTDDEQVIGVYLYFRVVGQEEFLEIPMSGEESAFSADIPAAAVTADGVEYYIMAEDETHESQLPEKGVYTISVSSTEKTVVEAPTETTSEFVSPSSVPESGDIFNTTSPVSP